MNVIISNKYQELLVTLDIDVIKSMTGEFEVDELISTFSNFFFNKMILDITAIKNYKDIAMIQKLSMSLDMSKVILVLDDSPESSSATYLSKLISMGIYNFTKNVDNIKYLMENPNQYKDVAHYHQLDNSVVFDNTSLTPSRSAGAIIGIKNITEHAGATTLTYLMKKHLELNYSVLAIEVNKSDFIYFNDKTLISTTHTELPKVMMKNTGFDIILLDLNDSGDEDVCTDIIHLIEPTTIKLNKMMRKSRMALEKLRGKKIVLNKSLLSNKDVMDFEFESRCEVFFNIPPLDERGKRHREIDNFLSKLGYIRQKGEETESDSSPKIFKLWKK